MFIIIIGLIINIVSKKTREDWSSNSGPITILKTREFNALPQGYSKRFIIPSITFFDSEKPVGGRIPLIKFVTSGTNISCCFVRVYSVGYTNLLRFSDVQDYCVVWNGSGYESSLNYNWRTSYQWGSGFNLLDYTADTSFRRLDLNVTTSTSGVLSCAIDLLIGGHPEINWNITIKP